MALGHPLGDVDEPVRTLDRREPGHVAHDRVLQREPQRAAGVVTRRHRAQVHTRRNDGVLLGPADPGRHQLVPHAGADGHEPGRAPRQHALGGDDGTGHSG